MSEEQSPVNFRCALCSRGYILRGDYLSRWCPGKCKKCGGQDPKKCRKCGERPLPTEPKLGARQTISRRKKEAKLA